MSIFKKQQRSNESVIVVGAGSSGVMDAFALHEAGFDVSLYAKGPDPRKDYDAEQYSSTGNGELGRFISRFEGEHYLGDSPMYPDMAGAFKKHVADGGWLGKFENEWDEFDKIWLKKRWDACEDEKKMSETEKIYVDGNGKAMEMWQEMIKDYPSLFEDVDLLNTGIVRLYDNPALYDWAVNRHKKEKVLERALNPSKTAEEYPYFAEACDNGLVAGSVEALGFSFNIHNFIDRVLSFLEKDGVKLNWEQEIVSVEVENKKVVGLKTKTDLLQAKHYALNPGAYADESLFAGTPAEGKVAGVAGRWMFMPSPEGFKRPVKIHGDVRREKGKSFPIVDVNLTHFTDEKGKEWLAVGGGYAYLGKPPFPKKCLAFEEMDAENERTVRLYLGRTYDKAKAEGKINYSNATCVRSFTYDDVPIMDNMPTEQGGVFRVNVGTNTGTTTIAPFTAQKTVRAFTGV